MEEFNIGDTIIIIESCSGAIKNKKYKLKDSGNEELIATNFEAQKGSGGCTCSFNWKKIKTEPKISNNGREFNFTQ